MLKKIFANVEQNNILTRVINHNNQPLSLNYVLCYIITTDEAFFESILQKSSHYAKLSKAFFLKLMCSHITRVYNY